MWLFPLGPTALDDDVAESNAAPLSIDTPNLERVPDIAPFSAVSIPNIDAPPGNRGPAFITATGGSVAFQDGFKIHTFTSVGDSVLNFAVGPRGT